MFAAANNRSRTIGKLPSMSGSFLGRLFYVRPKAALALPHVLPFFSGNNNGFSTYQKNLSRDIEGVLGKCKTEIRTKPDGDFILKECKLCTKRNKSNLDNIWKLNVRKDGSYYCFRCSLGGSYFDLKRKLNIPFDTIMNTSVTAVGQRSASSSVGISSSAQRNTLSSSSSSSSSDSGSDSDNGVEDAYLKAKGVAKAVAAGADQFVFPSQRQAHSCHTALFPPPPVDIERENESDDKTTTSAASSPISAATGAATGADPARDAVLSYLHSNRKLYDAVLQQYHVGYTKQQFLNESNKWEDKVCISFPWMMRSREVDRKTVVQEFGANDMPPKVASSKASPNEHNALIVARMKYRALETKGLQRIVPKGGMWGFFGWHTVRSTDSSIIITEGEYDAMAVAQALSMLPDTDELKSVPVVSLPNGCNSLPVDLMPRLERFSKVYLWMDYDKSGIDASEKFARKLGIARCYIVVPPLSMPASYGTFSCSEGGGEGDSAPQNRNSSNSNSNSSSSLDNNTEPSSFPACWSPPKDANDALRVMLQYETSLNTNRISSSCGDSDTDRAAAATTTTTTMIVPVERNIIASMVRSAKRLSHSKIQSFSDYRQQVLSAVRNKDVLEGGTEAPSLPRMSALVKGFRRGELVIVTGHTGCGKTTFLSQISLDFVNKGIPTLWGSFEIRNHRLIRKMLQQYYKQGVLSQLTEDKLEQVANDFEALPLQFLNFYGSSSIDDVFDALEYAVYKDDVQHIILDNLQFMMPRTTGSRGGFEKFDLQDQIIDKLRIFVTEKNVNVLLVIHPRKEDDNFPLSMASFSGSAKATQEADSVMILQKADDSLCVDIKKNRFDGTLGKVHLAFNPSSLNFVEIPTPPPSASSANAHGPKKFGGPK